MSKYPVKYASASKGDVEIESMATPHLANAYRKLVAPEQLQDSEAHVAQAFYVAQELKARGCTQGEAGEWIFPPKEES